VSKDAQTCAANIENEYVLSKDIAPFSEQLQEKSKEQCKSDSKCKLLKMHKRYECFDSKNPVYYDKPDEIEMINPPENMPTDPTDPKNKIQRYIYKLYTGSKRPKVTPLEKSEGNKCKEGKKKKEKLVFDINKMYTISELRKIKMPPSETEKAVLIKAFGEKAVEELLSSPQHYDHPIWKTKELYKNQEDTLIVKKSKIEPDDKMYPSIPQSVLNMVFKSISKDSESNARGMLALHSTGSGKTIASAGIIDAFWNTNRQIVFVSSIDALASNPPFKFYEAVKNVYPAFSKYKLEEIETMFKDRGVKFLSFTKMANRIKKSQNFFSMVKDATKKSPDNTAEFHNTPTKYLSSIYGHSESFLSSALPKAGVNNWDDFIDLDNAIIIVDEVHNLFRPLPNQKGDHNYVESHFINKRYDGLNTYKHHNFNHPNMKIVILTATPGDNPKDLLKLLNIVRNPTKPIIQEFDVNDANAIKSFKEEIVGLVSYFDMSNDPGKFPQLLDIGPKHYPMSDKQFAKYVEAYNDNIKQKQNYDTLAKKNQLNKYWNKSRKYSNMLYTINKEDDIAEASSKLPALLASITKYNKDKHYVYSSFYENKGSSNGILQIERELVNMGYEKLSIAEAKKMNGDANLMTKKRRYVMATLKEIGDSAGKNLNELLKVYNHASNSDGSIVHVMLASNKFNEGIDLKAVRHIHFFEPLLTMASDIQTIGRARRYCSHADLEYDKWNVTIHRYLSDLPVSMDVGKMLKLEKELDIINNSIKDLEDKEKNAASKDEKKAIKESLKETKKTLTKLKQEMKSESKLNLAEMKNIDDFIYNEALSRAKKLDVMLHSMKEAAIDCQILHTFHNDTQITCMERN
jgi:hypothetical protein